MSSLAMIWSLMLSYTLCGMIFFARRSSLPLGRRRFTVGFARASAMPLREASSFSEALLMSIGAAAFASALASGFGGASAFLASAFGAGAGVVALAAGAFVSVFGVSAFWAFAANARPRAASAAIRTAGILLMGVFSCCWPVGAAVVYPYPGLAVISSV